MQLASKAAKFGRIMQKNSYYAAECYSSSLILGQVDSPYATSY